MCLSPIPLRAKIYRDESSGSVVFPTGGSVYVPCGRCSACRITRARMWSVRIMHECARFDHNVFVTLTYDDDHLKGPSLVKEDVTLFLKRLRKNLSPRLIRYYLSGEYGDIGKRPHYHAILFNVSKQDEEIISRSWGQGFVYIGDVTSDSASYVASYTMKKLNGPLASEYVKKGLVPEFARMSLKPGIGENYALSNSQFIKDNNFIVAKGKKVGVPRYYSNQILSPSEKVSRSEMMSELSQERLQRIQEKYKMEKMDSESLQEFLRRARAQQSADIKARQNLKRRIL